VKLRYLLLFVPLFLAGCAEPACRAGTNGLCADPDGSDAPPFPAYYASPPPQVPVAPVYVGPSPGTVISHMLDEPPPQQEHCISRYNHGWADFGKAWNPILERDIEAFSSTCKG
jgi:hypothetical protein